VPNPTVGFTGDIDGVWLMPYDSAGLLVEASRAWVAAAPVASDRERATALFATADRPEKISHNGVLYLREGAIRGQLIDRHGLTAKQWHTNLVSLIERQHRYRVYLVDSRHNMRVELNGISDDPTFNSGRAWKVEVPWRELES
jgi:hypothetical protein